MAVGTAVSSHSPVLKKPYLCSCGLHTLLDHADSGLSAWKMATSGNLGT